MAAKKGLGKGLDLLIPNESKKKSNDKPEVKSEKVEVELYVDINKVEPNREQPRKQFDEDLLIELADSIKQFGVLQPLLVQKKDDYYEIIAGERRWRASRMAGLKKVPVLIREYDEKEVLEISLIENIQRENLNAVEEAIAYQKLMNEFNMKQDEIAERVSKSRATITNSIRLLKLDSKVQQMLVEGLISSGHARALLAIENGELQYLAAQRIIDEKLSVRDTEKLVKEFLKPKKEAVVKERNDFIYRDIEEKIKNIIGTKVSIKSKSNDKGKIELEYYSKDELERIIYLLESIHHK